MKKKITTTFYDFTGVTTNIFWQSSYNQVLNGQYQPRITPCGGAFTLPAFSALGHYKVNAHFAVITHMSPELRAWFLEINNNVHTLTPAGKNAKIYNGIHPDSMRWKIEPDIPNGPRIYPFQNTGPGVVSIQNPERIYLTPGTVPGTYTLTATYDSPYLHFNKP